MQVILKPVPDSLRDPKTFLAATKEYSIKRYVVIVDRGSSPGTFLRMGMDFILPLKDTSRMIDYSFGIEKSFIYDGRGINASRNRIGDLILYMFEDTMLRYEEESNFIFMISRGKRSQDSGTFQFSPPLMWVLRVCMLCTRRGRTLNRRSTQ